MALLKFVNNFCPLKTQSNIRKNRSKTKATDGSLTIIKLFRWFGCIVATTLLIFQHLENIINATDIVKSNVLQQHCGFTVRQKGFGWKAMGTLAPPGFPSAGQNGPNVSETKK